MVDSDGSLSWIYMMGDPGRSTWWILVDPGGGSGLIHVEALGVLLDPSRESWLSNWCSQVDSSGGSWCILVMDTGRS